MFPGDQWDDSAGASLNSGARDNAESFCDVGFKAFGCPTTSGAWAWADVGAGSTQVLLTHMEQIHFTVDMEQGGCRKPVELWPFPFLLSFGGR